MIPAQELEDARPADVESRLAAGQLSPGDLVFQNRSWVTLLDD